MTKSSVVPNHDGSEIIKEDSNVYLYINTHNYLLYLPETSIFTVACAIH